MKSAEFGTFLVTLPFPTPMSFLVTKGELQQILVNVLPPSETVLCEPRKESVSKWKNHHVALKSKLICLRFNSPPGVFRNTLRKERSKPFLDVPLDWLLVCLFWQCEQVTDWSVLIATTYKRRTKVSSYHMKQTKVSCYMYPQQKQEDWLVVYSRSNLIGVKYIHLSLTHSPTHSLLQKHRHARRARLFFVNNKSLEVLNVCQSMVLLVWSVKSDW